MNKAILMAALMTVASIAGAVNERGNKNFTGEVNFEGTVGIKGTDISASAAEINIMDGATASTAELNIMKGVTATTAEINYGDDVSAGQRSESVTNGQAITLLSTDREVTLTGIGQADTYTNTVSIALPYPVGKEFLIRVAAASTNVILFADSTTVLDLDADVVLSASDSLRIYTTATNAATADIYNGANLALGSVRLSEMVAAVQTSLGLADTSAQKADVWGAPTATPSPALLENTVAIQAKTAAAGDLEEFRLIRVWTSETSLGAASTNNIETLVLSTGTAVDTVTEHADYRYVTATDGSAVATITGTAVGTNYVMVSDGSSVSATAITFVE